LASAHYPEQDSNNPVKTGASETAAKKQRRIQRTFGDSDRYETFRNHLLDGGFNAIQVQLIADAIRNSGLELVDGD